jgi:hypothetical protein
MTERVARGDETRHSGAPDRASLDFRAGLRIFEKSPQRSGQGRDLPISEA